MTDNFWGNLDTNSTTGAFESGGGSFEPLPNGTQVLAHIEDAKWAEDQRSFERYIELKWSVLQPEEYKNRKVFQKVKVLDGEIKKADKAKMMLAAIDKNASGGKLLSTGKAPTDIEMMRHLSSKPMILKLGVWEMEGKKGNWVQAVAPKNGAKVTDAHKKDATQAPTSTDEFSDDIQW